MTGIKIERLCETCGKAIVRHQSQFREHAFCSRECAKIFTSNRMHEYNITKNPMNTSAGYTQEMREIIRAREQKNKGPCAPNTYPKKCGKHEHRAVAEVMIGRKLFPDEVVHHINGNKHDNRKENLMVLTRKEHARLHALQRKEGDAKC